MGSKGGGSSAPASEQVVKNETVIPEYFRPYLERTLERGEQLSLEPYQAYGQPRTAGFTPEQLQSFNMTQQNVGAYSGDLNNARNLAADAGRALPDINMSEYMNPYTQNVINVAKREAWRDDQILGNQLDANAVNAGAFGGARHAIQESEARRNLSQRLSDIQTQGMSEAYDRGVAALGADRSAQAQAAGLSSNIGAAAQDLGLRDAAAVGAVGGQRQAQQQLLMDQAYQDFLAQREDPYERLAQYSGILRGYQPSGNRYETVNTTTPSPSVLSQVAGLGAAGVGIGKIAGAFKEGGPVKKYAEGGSVLPEVPHFYRFEPPYHPSMYQDPLEKQPRKSIFEDRDSIFSGQNSRFKDQPSIFNKTRANAKTGYWKGKDEGLPGTMDIEGGAAAQPSVLPEPGPDWTGGVRPPLRILEDEGPRYALPNIRRSMQDESVLPGAPMKAVPQGGEKQPPIPQDKPSILPPAIKEEVAAKAAETPLEPSAAKDTLAVTQDAATEGAPDWALPLIAAGFATMAGTSPYAMVNIGQGGLAGMKEYGEQKKSKLEKRTVDLKESELRNNVLLKSRELDIKASEALTTEKYRKDWAEISRRKNEIDDKVADGTMGLKKAQLEINKLTAEANQLIRLDAIDQRREAAMLNKETRAEANENALLQGINKALEDGGLSVEESNRLKAQRLQILISRMKPLDAANPPKGFHPAKK